MLFISGYPRSGTDLMRGLICKDEKTFPPLKESEYFKDLVYCYHRAKDRWNRYTHDYFKNQEQLKTIHKQILDTYLNHIYNLYGNDKKLVHKKPLFCYYFPELDELYPDQCEFIVMVRDPRDNLSSLLKIKRNEGISCFTLLQEYLDCYYRCLNQLRDKSNLLIVRFEDLLVNTEQAMNQIREFTGLELNFNPKEENYPSRRSGDSRYLTENDGKPINSNNIGNYELTQEELNLIMNNKENLEYHLNMKLFYEKE